MASRLRASDESMPASFSLQDLHPLALRVDFRLGLLRCVDDVGGELRPDCRSKPRDQRLGEGLLLIERGAHAEAELGVVFEERVGPRRPAALRVLAVGRGGQVAAVDRRAAGGIGDVEPIAEELGEQLDVGRFAAARAGARELKERLQQLQILHLRVRKLGAIDFGQVQEELPVLALGFAQRSLRRHVDGLVAGVALALDRAHFHADARSRCSLPEQPAACSDRVSMPFHFGLAHLKVAGALSPSSATVDLGADHSVRANHDALAALDAEILVPHRNELRDVALLPLRGGRREGAARGNGADRKQIALAGSDLAEHIVDELGSLAGDGRRMMIEVGRCGRRAIRLCGDARAPHRRRRSSSARPLRRACRRSS